MKYVISDCNVVDVENDGRILPHKDILVDGSVIAKISEHGKEIFEGARRIDATGCYAVPGLIDLHVHLFGTGMPSKVLGAGKSQQRLIRFIHTGLGKKILGALVSSAAKNQLYSGVTTLRAVGDFCGSDIELKRRTDAGKGAAAGLRMFVSGMAITAPGGHGAGTFANTAQTTEDLERLVDEQVAAGADFIKICVTGGVMDAKKRGEPGEVKMTEEQVRAVCDRAHGSGKKVAAHVQSERGAEIAALCGVDSIEHGARLGENSLGALRERGGAVVVTYSPALPFAKLPPEMTRMGELCKINSEAVMDGMTVGAKQAIAAGIDVGMGTDSSCPYCTQYDMWREVVYFSRFVGVSSAQALRVATLGNARILGIEGITGSVAEGKSADILVLKRDPIADLSALSEIAFMFAQGRFIDAPKPKKMKKIDAVLDTLMSSVGE